MHDRGLSFKKMAKHSIIYQSNETFDAIHTRIISELINKSNRKQLILFH